MRCRIDDLVIVVRSEVGNEGRIGRIVGRAVPGARLPDGVDTLASDDWIVQGRFNTCDSFTATISGVDFGAWDGPICAVALLPFPDSSLRPIRGDGLTDDAPAEIDKPQPVEA